MEQHINTKRAVTTVTKTLTLDLIDATGAATPLDTELAYNAADPPPSSPSPARSAGPSGATFSSPGSTSRPATATSTSGRAWTTTPTPS